MVALNWWREGCGGVDTVLGCWSRSEHAASWQPAGAPPALTQLTSSLEPRPEQNAERLEKASGNVRRANVSTEEIRSRRLNHLPSFNRIHPFIQLTSLTRHRPFHLTLPTLRPSASG